MNRIFSEVIIIGAGPAGCAAAIQLKRAGLNPLIFEKDQVGGLARNANMIENYLGFPDGITGFKFISLLSDHLHKINVSLIKEEIIKIEWNKEKEKFIINSNSNQYKSKFLILATGTIPKRISVPGEDELYNLKLLFYEVAKIQKKKIINKNIAIIGGGDVAFDYALQLESLTNKISIYFRTNNSQCLPLLLKRVEFNKKIKIIKNKEVSRLLCKKMENNSTLIEIKFNDKSKSYHDIVIIAIGRLTNAKLIENKQNIWKSNKKLFLIGDLKNNSYRQVTIAASDGLKSAMKIINYKKELDLY